MEAMQCIICFDKYTETKRRPVVCPYCHHYACAPCQKTCLLSSSSDPRCFHCKQTWSRQFLVDSFDKMFVLQKYKSHREKVLLEREKSMVPATQPQYVNYKLHKQLVDTMDQRAIEIHELKQTIRKLTEENANDDARARRIKQSNYQSDGCRRQENGDSETRAKKPKLTYVKKCPHAECRGYVSSNGICGTCETKVCMECGELASEGHECKEEDVATAKLLERDTKSCPSCSTPIYRIAGCDQMFCTQCHTAFSWKTGAIETNHIHNPHYYEWMRDTGRHIPRERGDVPCGEYISVYDLQRVVKAADANEELGHRISEWHRLITHVEQNQVRHLRRKMQQTPDSNLDLRLQYLSNEITEEDWKTRLQRREKLRQKNNDLYLTFDMFVTAGKDIMRKIQVPSVVRKEDISGVCDELDALKDYTENSLKGIWESYKNKATMGINFERFGYEPWWYHH